MAKRSIQQLVPRFGVRGRRSRIISGERPRNMIRAWRREFGCNPPAQWLRLVPDSCFYKGGFKGGA